MNGVIQLQGIQVFGFHGLHENERRDGQPFVVDVGMVLDVTGAAVADDISRTVDYGQVMRDVCGVMTGPPFKLLESLAWAIGRLLLEKHPVLSEVTVRVHKPRAPLAGIVSDVSVEVTCCR